jgi:hypothetical protein
MGLDLYCNNESWGCTYSGVHIVRKYFIKATIKYMEQIDNNKELPFYEPLKSFRNICDFERKKDEDDGQFDGNKKQVIDFLKSLLPEKINTEMFDWIRPLNINYQPWNKTPFSLSYFGLFGLKTFVNHSDCDGYFTVGNSYDILGLLSRIGNFLFEEIDQDEKDWIMDLIKLFEHSVKHNQDILFS